MHPVLFDIPLSLTTVWVVALLFGLGGAIRTRFAPAARDASYLAEFLGLNVQWGKAVQSWGKAAQQGLMSAASAGVITFAIKWVAIEKFGKESVPLHTYGLCMALAFMLGISLASRQAVREQLPPVPLRDRFGAPLKDKDGKPLFIGAGELVGEMAFTLLLAGLGGARLLYIITRWDTEYAANPMKALHVWEGGLVFYGGFILATIAAFFFIRSRRISFWPYADVLIPSVALGHALGRIGCFAAGCCFGNVAHDGFPLTVQFPPGSPAFYEHFMAHLLPAGATHSLAVYPTQLFEAVGETLIFMALLLIRQRKRFHGQVVLSYFFLYPLLRTVMEMFRGDSIRGFLFHWPEKGREMLLSTSQAVSIGLALCGMGLTWVILRSQKRANAGPSTSHPISQDSAA